MKQINLFGFEEEEDNNWLDEWDSMPEYNNPKPLPPQITVTFKFRNDEDFIVFMDVVKEKLFNNERVISGKQKKNEYSVWYPLDQRPSENVYVLKKCKWCDRDAERLDYREIDGITSKIHSCLQCFMLDTKYLIDRSYGK